MNRFNPLIWLGALADHLKTHAKDWAVFVAVMGYGYTVVHRTAAEMDSAGNILFKILGVVGIVHGSKTIAATIWGNESKSEQPDEPKKPAGE